MEKMSNISQECMEEFIAAAQRAARYGLVVCGSGNLSLRIDSKRMLITTSGAWMEEMSDDQITVCKILDCAPLDGKRPSIEIGFHAGILLNRKDVNVVLHFQSLYATALACSNKQDLNFNVTPEIPYHVGPIVIVPYMNPGSDDLARSVISALNGHDLVVIQNHGQVTVGKDFRDALQKAMFFEFACGILLHAGDQIQTIPEKAISFLFDARKKYSQPTQAV